MTRGVVAGVLALLLVGCVQLANGAEDVKAVWDLRETHVIEAVGWPEDAGSSFEARSAEGLERILLPGDVVVEGEFRAAPSRLGGIGTLPYEDELLDLIVTFERESIDAVVDRAGRYADMLGADLGDIRAWAAANADGQDLSPGGAQADSEEVELPDGSIGYLSTRAFANGGAVLRVTYFWPPDEDDGSTSEPQG